MKQKLMQFMYGRNGVDLFSRFLLYASLVSFLLRLIAGDGALGRIFWYITLALIIYCYFRVFSKNLDKRRAENAKYYELRTRFLGLFRDWRDRRRQSKDYCFFRCPSCRAMLRVPRGKGKIRVTCRKCGTAFERKT